MSHTKAEAAEYWRIVLAEKRQILKAQEAHTAEIRSEISVLEAYLSSLAAAGRHPSNSPFAMQRT